MNEISALNNPWEVDVPLNTSNLFLMFCTLEEGCRIDIHITTHDATQQK